MYAPNTKFRSALTTTVYKYAFRHILLVNVYGNRRVDIRTTIEEEVIERTYPALKRNLLTLKGGGHKNSNC